MTFKDGLGFGLEATTLVHETLDCNRIIGGASSRTAGGGAAIAVETRREARSALKNMRKIMRETKMK